MELNTNSELSHLLDNFMAIQINYNSFNDLAKDDIITAMAN